MRPLQRLVAGSLDGVGDRALINNDFCEACQSGGRLLLCERCPRAFHVQCIERLVDFESVKPAESWCCPVCLYGESILRGKGVEQMPEEEMRARMAESLRDSKRSRAASIRQRDVFLLQHWGELVPFASRPALTRMRKAREGRKPLEVGTIVQVDTGRTFYDAIVLSQTSPAVYLVADLVTKTQELREEKWLLAYLPGQRGGDVPDFLSFARRPIVSETTTLKEYQQVGVNWLIQSFFNRCGGILADDMGLGKTLQTLAFLSYLQASGFSRGPALVVVPLSCAGNWAREDFLFAANQKACWRAGDCQSTLRLDEHHRERQPRVLHLFFLRVI
ncbi:unnamed protein product [Durusdinium trenchii]|uniref:PHD-type domain-containing protein n=1 Tax=Durusdinium trenchii TaxID=1381693 RepID=A0ABP0SQ34_9DINO